MAGPGGVLLDHEIVNLSVGGLSIRVPEVESVGTVVDLTIQFPGLAATIKTKGKVVWSKEGDPNELGIRFDKLDGQDRNVLRRYLYAAEGAA